MGSVLGVRVDTVHGVLWATLAAVRQQPGYVPADSAVAAIIRVALRDGRVERRWNLPPSPHGHTLGDLAIGPSGDVFVSDSDDPVLYRLRPGADTLEHVTSPLFHQNGVIPARVMRFTLSGDGRSIRTAEVLDRNPAIADEPTISTIVGRAFVYVANSQWEKFGPDGARTRGVPLTAPVLLAVPLSRQAGRRGPTGSTEASRRSCVRRR